MEKEASRIYTGTFYIVGDKIVYTLDTSDEEAIDHYQLWDIAVPKLFPDIPFDLKQDLKQDAVYGADRGRVVFKGERSRTGTPTAGTFSIYGTPDSKKHLTKLKQLFGLNKIDKLDQFNLETDFSTDPHYKVQGRDKRLLDEVLRSYKNQFEERPSEIRIAGWTKTEPDPRRVFVSKTT
jgi:hypothetical protein